MYTKNAEIKAGIVVLAASVALLGLLFFATGGTFLKDFREIHLRLEVGGLAPKKGDPVFVNGVEVGSIKDLGFRSQRRKGEEQLTAPDRKAVLAMHPEVLDMKAAEAEAFWANAEVRETYVWMLAQIKEERNLPRGTRGEISESLVGSRTIQLVLGLSTEDLSDEDTVAEPIFVAQAANLGRIADRVEGLADKAEVFIDKAGVVTDDASSALKAVRRVVERLEEEVAKGRISDMLDDLKLTAASLKRTVAAAEGRMEDIVLNVADTAADLRKIAATGVRLSAGMEKDVKEILTEVKSVAGKLDGILERAAPKLDRFLDDANRTASNLAELSDDLKELGPDAQAFVKNLGRDVDTIADLLIDTGHNLLDTSEEVRAHPWKILNKPEGEEIAYENIRTTMQAYVRAMSRMNLASESLKQMLARGVPEDGRSRQLYARTLAEFERSVDRYRQLETRLMELLQDPKVPPSSGARRGMRQNR